MSPSLLPMSGTASGLLRRVLSPLPEAVALWALDLDDWSAVHPVSGLSVNEAERAARLRFDLDRQRYVAGRQAMRWLLAERLGRKPSELILANGPRGKPVLKGRDAWLEFNLSHSRAQALYGLSDGPPIGVDIEELRTLDDAEALARSHFSATEFARWSSHSPADRPAAFLRCWTRKEACLKALGLGLAVEPHSFSAGTDAAPARVTIEHEGRSSAVDVWSLQLVEPNRVCALARTVTRTTRPAPTQR